MDFLVLRELTSHPTRVIINFSYSGRYGSLSGYRQSGSNPGVL
jgi:hypothetical protein